MTVDAHQHLLDDSRWHYPWMSAEYSPLRGAFGVCDLRKAIAGTAVDATIAVQAIGDPGETEWLLEIARGDELIAAVVGWVDLAAADVHDRIAALQADGSLLRGIRHQVEDERDPDWISRPEVIRGLRSVANAGLTFDLLIQRRNQPSVDLLARLVPELRLVVDHGANPQIAAGEWGTWTSSLRALAAHPQVFCKLSGLVTDAPWDRWRTSGLQRYFEEIVAAFGSERVMFGSDWPVCTVAASYSEVYELALESIAALSADEQIDVFDRSARRFYQIEDRSASG